MPYVGNEPTSNFASVTKDLFSGDGSTVAFTLSKASTTNGVAVFVENVRQEPTIAYAVSGTTLTFTAAPVTSSGNNIYVLHHNAVASTANHPAAQDLTAVKGTFTGDVSIDGGSFVFNESSADKEFRIEPNGNAIMLVVDGGNDAVVIGQSAPETTITGGTPSLQVIGSAYDSIVGLTRRQASAYGPQLALCKSRNTSVASYTIVQDDDSCGSIVAYGDDGTNLDTPVASIGFNVDGTPGANDMPGRINFNTTTDGAASLTERMRIDNVGTTTIFAGSAPLVLGRNNSSGSVSCITFNNSSTAVSSISGQCFRIMGDGDVENTNNSYGAISDIKLKENIADASSQWDDIKAVKVKNFSYKKDELDNANMIGVIAQDLEASGMSGLITERYDFEDGKDSETMSKSVKYSVLYMKAVKALQEAMTRIETLEAKVKTLEDA